jgi:hypothetical protein
VALLHDPKKVNRAGFLTAEALGCSEKVLPVLAGVALGMSMH